MSVKVLNGVHILCVDDSPESLELLRRILVKQGALVTTCTSAESAIAALKESHFDVMVSDLSMPPGLDGYDLVHVLRRMENQDPARHVTPAVAVSGDAHLPSVKRRFADFQVYMAKPATKKSLVYVVERLLQADGEATEFGSLDNWEAVQASKASVIASEVAAMASAAAVEATVAAAQAASAAADATRAAADAKAAALEAEKKANASANHSPDPL